MVNSHGRFAWYELITTDLEAASVFYTKVIGWSARDASAPGRPYTLFTVGKASVSGLMELPEDAKKMGGKPSWVGYVAVDDVDATAERIKHLGGAVQVPPIDVWPASYPSRQVGELDRTSGYWVNRSVAEYCGLRTVELESAYSAEPALAAYRTAGR